MRIAIGSDHAGFGLKEVVRAHLGAAGHEVQDLGTHSTDSVDYPDFAHQVAQAVASGEVDRGMLVCGTGQGMAMAANKVEGVRAGVCSDVFSARGTRAHNDANVLCLGERVVGAGLAIEIVDTWMSTGFEGGRHQRRVDKIQR